MKHDEVEDMADDYEPPDDDCYVAWQWCVSSDWKSLPEQGGLFDQDERLMNGVFLIAARHRNIKEHMRVNDETRIEQWDKLR